MLDHPYDPRNHCAQSLYPFSLEFLKWETHRFVFLSLYSIFQNPLKNINRKWTPLFYQHQKRKLSNSFWKRTSEACLQILHYINSIIADCSFSVIFVPNTSFFLPFIYTLILTKLQQYSRTSSIWHPSIQHSSTMFVDELDLLNRWRKLLASFSSTITDPVKRQINEHKCNFFRWLWRLRELCHEIQPNYEITKSPFN